MKLVFSLMALCAILFSSFLFTGCGGGSSPTLTPTPPTEGIYQVEFISNGGQSLDSSSIPVVQPGVWFAVWVDGIKNPLTRSRGGDAITYTWLKNGQPFQPEVHDVNGSKFYSIGTQGDDSLADIPFQVTATFCVGGQQYIARRTFFIAPNDGPGPVIPWHDRLSADLQVGPDVNGYKTVTLTVKNISGYPLDTIFVMVDYSVTPIGDLVATIYDWGHITQTQATIGCYDYMSGGTCTRNGTAAPVNTGVFMGLAWMRFDEFAAGEIIILQASYRAG